MKSRNIKFFIILMAALALLASCQDRKTVKADATQAVEIFKLDTLRIDLDSISIANQVRSDRWAQMPVNEVIDSLKFIAATDPELIMKDSDDLFGHYMGRLKYYQPNIPRSFYSRLFPMEEIRIRTREISSTKVDSFNRKIYLKEGFMEFEERKYIYLYAFLEKPECLFLLFTKEGKYSPALDLITVSKKDFTVVDKLELYGGIYDSYSVDFWFSEFSSNYNKLNVTTIKNLAQGKYDLDTTTQAFTILSSGQIRES